MELDADACDTLRRNRGDDWKIIEGDVANLDGHAFTGIDLVAGGVPCPRSPSRASSLAGTTSETYSPRRFGWSAIRPRAVLLENVRGLGTGKFDAYRAHVLGRLGELGYHACWRLIHASEHGVPQLRPRFVLVAVANPWAAAFRWPGPLPGPPPTVGATLADLMGSAGWPGAAAWAARADRIAPTIVGGSRSTADRISARLGRGPPGVSSASTAWASPPARQDLASRPTSLRS